MAAAEPVELDEDWQSVSGNEQSCIPRQNDPLTSQVPREKRTYQVSIHSA